MAESRVTRRDGIAHNHGAMVGLTNGEYGARGHARGQRRVVDWHKP